MALAGAHLRLLLDPGGVTTGAGGGALRSGAPNIAVSCVWPSSIVAGRSAVFGRRAVSRGVNASKNACVRVEICPESVFFCKAASSLRAYSIAL